MTPDISVLTGASSILATATQATVGSIGFAVDIVILQIGCLRASTNRKGLSSVLQAQHSISEDDSVHRHFCIKCVYSVLGHVGLATVPISSSSMV